MSLLQNSKRGNCVDMKLKEKIPWLMGRLQRTLFPCLEECCVTPLTEQEKHLVKVLEIIGIEKHIQKNR